MAEVKIVRDDVTLRQLWSNPVFLSQAGLTSLLVGTTFVATAFEYWPPFCSYDAWLFFINLGTASSFAIIEIASVLCWIIFECDNWVYYVLVCFIHGAVLLVGGIFFFIDYASTCSGGYAWPCNDILMHRKAVTDNCGVSIMEATIEGFLMCIAFGYLIFAASITLMREKFSL